jgi:hypothetical protein
MDKRDAGMADSLSSVVRRFGWQLGTLSGGFAGRLLWDAAFPPLAAGVLVEAGRFEGVTRDLGAE